MSSMRRSVSLSQYDMAVHLWLALVHADIANQAQHFRLLTDLYPQIVLYRKIKKTHFGAAERTDGRKPAGE